MGDIGKFVEQKPILDIGSQAVKRTIDTKIPDYSEARKGSIRAEHQLDERIEEIKIAEAEFEKAQATLKAVDKNSDGYKAIYDRYKLADQNVDRAYDNRTQAEKDFELAKIAVKRAQAMENVVPTDSVLDSRVDDLISAIGFKTKSPRIDVAQVAQTTKPIQISLEGEIDEIRQRALQAIESQGSDYRFFVVGNQQEYAALHKPQLIQFIRGTNDPNKLSSIVPISVSQARKKANLKQIFLGSDAKTTAESFRQIRDLTTEPLASKALGGSGRDIFAEDLRRAVDNQINITQPHAKREREAAFGVDIATLSGKEDQQRYGTMTAQEWLDRLQEVRRSAGLRKAFDIMHWDNDISRDLLQTAHEVMDKTFSDKPDETRRYINVLKKARGSKPTDEKAAKRLLSISAKKDVINARDRLIDLVRPPQERIPITTHGDFSRSGKKEREFAVRDDAFGRFRTEWLTLAQVGESDNILDKGHKQYSLLNELIQEGIRISKHVSLLDAPLEQMKSASTISQVAQKEQLSDLQRDLLRRDELS